MYFILNKGLDASIGLRELVRKLRGGRHRYQLATYMTPLTVSPAQIQDTLARMSYFEDWDREHLARLVGGARQFTLTRKEKLVSKGDRLDALFIVVSGQMRLAIPLANGAERVVSLVDRGESFGEPCLIRSEPCPFDVVAGKDSHLIAIDALVYRRELRASPAMAEHALSVVSQRMLQMLRDLEICSQPSGVQRVAYFLMQLQPSGEATNVEIRLPALKRDIAAKLGLSQETFSRVTAFMDQQGFIQLNGSSFRVDDWPRLQQLAKAGCPMDAAGKS